MKSVSSNIRRARPLLGTFVEITAGGGAAIDGHAAVDAAFALIEEVQRRMSFHDPSSVLSRLNRYGFRHAVQVDAWTFEVLEKSAHLFHVSGGAFDVTVGSKLQELGFLPSVDDRRSYGPSAGNLEPGFDQVDLLGDRHVRFRDRRLQIDLGGIAKGYAVDLATDALRAAGVEQAVVNAGGDLRVFGSRSATVHIRSPVDPYIAFIAVPAWNQALATSATYFSRAREDNSPLLDPRRKCSVGAIGSITVVAKTALLADALTKVVAVDGTDCWPVLQKFQAAALRVTRDGDVSYTPNWHETINRSS